MIDLPTLPAAGATQAAESTNGTRASSTFGPLTGGETNPSVTVTVGALGLLLVSVSVNAYNSTANELSVASFSASGANTLAADDTRGGCLWSSGISHSLGT